MGVLPSDILKRHELGHTKPKEGDVDQKPKPPPRVKKEPASKKRAIQEDISIDRPPNKVIRSARACNRCCKSKSVWCPPLFLAVADFLCSHPLDSAATGNHHARDARLEASSVFSTATPQTALRRTWPTRPRLIRARARVLVPRETRERTMVMDEEDYRSEDSTSTSGISRARVCLSLLSRPTRFRFDHPLSTKLTNPTIPCLPRPFITRALTLDPPPLITTRELPTRSPIANLNLTLAQLSFQSPTLSLNNLPSQPSLCPFPMLSLPPHPRRRHHGTRRRTDERRRAAEEPMGTTWISST